MGEFKKQLHCTEGSGDPVRLVAAAVLEVLDEHVGHAVGHVVVLGAGQDRRVAFGVRRGDVGAALQEQVGRLDEAAGCGKMEGANQGTSVPG